MDIGYKCAHLLRQKSRPVWNSVKSWPIQRKSELNWIKNNLNFGIKTDLVPCGADADRYMSGFCLQISGPEIRHTCILLHPFHMGQARFFAEIQTISGTVYIWRSNIISTYMSWNCHLNRLYNKPISTLYEKNYVFKGYNVVSNSTQLFAVN